MDVYDSTFGQLCQEHYIFNVSSRDFERSSRTLMVLREDLFIGVSTLVPVYFNSFVSLKIIAIMLCLINSLYHVNFEANFETKPI